VPIVLVVPVVPVLPVVLVVLVVPVVLVGTAASSVRVVPAVAAVGDGELPPPQPASAVASSPAARVWWGKRVAWLMAGRGAT
jgi:hypothetical protein